TGKLAIDIKGGNHGFLEKSISSLSQAIVQLNSNVMKINEDNESIRKLLIGFENGPLNSPGIKRKVETMKESSLEANEEIEEILINNKPLTNHLRSEIKKKFGEDLGQTLGHYEQKYPKQMEQIKKELVKLVPPNSTFKEALKKAADSLKNDKMNKTC
ncbi:unnamed protein product, partial [Brachionus calyciflorus]